MKGNDGSGNIEERDEWQTPQKLWDKLDYQYNFKLDCCANYNNRKCKLWWNDFGSLESYEQPFLNKMVCWMNPPFSKANEMFEHFFKIVKSGVAIYRCDNMETKLWQDIILKNANWVFIPKGRISYEGMEGKGSRFPSALIGFNVDIPKGLDGTILYTEKIKTYNPELMKKLIKVSTEV